MIKTLLTLTFWTGAAAALPAQAVQQIQIDAGGVNVQLLDVPPDTPPELSYRAQGSTCQPEVAITSEDGLLKARHIKSCHGRGENEGTVFTLKLSAQSSFALKLSAGGVQLSGELAHYRNIDLAVKVGGIRNNRSDLALEQERVFLIGAKGWARRDSGEQSMNIELDYGGIRLN